MLQCTFFTVYIDHVTVYMFYSVYQSCNCVHLLQCIDHVTVYIVRFAGNATDYVLELAAHHRAAFLVSPCCVGMLHMSVHLLHGLCLSGKVDGLHCLSIDCKKWVFIAKKTLCKLHITDLANGRVLICFSYVTNVPCCVCAICCSCTFGVPFLYVCICASCSHACCIRAWHASLIAQDWNNWITSGLLDTDLQGSSSFHWPGVAASAPLSSNGECDYAVACVNASLVYSLVGCLVSCLIFNQQNMCHSVSAWLLQLPLPFRCTMQCANVAKAAFVAIWQKQSCNVKGIMWIYEKSLHRSLSPVLLQLTLSCPLTPLHWGKFPDDHHMPHSLTLLSPHANAWKVPSWPPHASLSHSFLSHHTNAWTIPW
jgi:hypothetical protein